jgi:hypothetical protein
MEAASFIFVICLLIPGVVLVLMVRRDFKMKAKAIEAQQMAALRQPRMTSRQALSRVRAAARKQVDPWVSMTPSSISEVFKKFYQDDPGINVDSSLINAAFEKFTEETRIKQ